MSSTTVSWLGLQADYSRPEREIMSQLPVTEQQLVHVLKSLTDGEIGPGVIPSDKRLPAAVTGVSLEHPSSPGPVFTAPEDLEFGSAKPKRRKKLYYLIWTWQNSRPFKTKVKAQAKLKTWKRWYERQGWKVTKLGAGHLAESPDGQRHVVQLHEYDALTHERLN